MNIGEIIRAARKNAGLTQSQLGERLGVTGSMIGQWETNKRQPKSTTISSIAIALGKPFVDLFLSKIDTDLDIVTERYKAAKSSDDSFDETLLMVREIEYIKSHPFETEEEKNLMKESEAFMHEVDSIAITQDGHDFLYAYIKLNDLGRKEAVKRVEELSQLPQYQRPAATETPLTPSQPSQQEEPTPPQENAAQPHSDP